MERALTDLEERLRRGEVLLLDGGMGTELERRGVSMNDQAWAGAAVHTHPDMVRALHEDYIRAGADVITTNTFAASRPILAAAGLGDRVREINARAVALAREARDTAADGRQVWIAGSLSPMAPGADPRQRPPQREMAANFREQADALAAGGVDLIALEMLRDVGLSVAALEAATATGLPVWCGFSCRATEDGRLLLDPSVDGRTEIAFADVIGPVMARGGSLLAVMHTAARDIPRALAVARQGWAGPLGAYPETGHFIMPHWQFVDIVSPQALAVEAERWVIDGVQVIGGCCGTGPEHIRVLRERLPRRLARP